ncbi:MAG: class I tRNA ligase family protein [Candidatus Nanopelagicaceae bacterium]|nr:class I tRNA ligase family protein [Candidatus Nanopelagicaceae bacterium]
MRSWPEVYLPPAPANIKAPELKLLDSYKGSLVPVNQRVVTSYVCGITPYDATHLGHAATYLTFDLIHRYLLARGQELLFAENITDIDDPLLERANRDKVDWQTLATSQIDLFVGDMTALHVIPPKYYRGVIESMDLIDEFIQTCQSNSLSYFVDRDLYLDLSKVEEFPGNLPMPLADAIALFKERGGDPERSGKRHPLDPLLWRAHRENEPQWESSAGAGRPGWHIECTAIALRSLPRGEHTSITLQGGGSDLIFPHHYMTALQAKALTKVDFATAYVHAGMIGLDGEKMSKSKGNLVFVSKLLASGVRASAIRVALMLEHYQSDRMWDEELLTTANQIINRLEFNLARNEVAPTLSVIQDIVEALSNNLDTPKVLKLLGQWCERTESGVAGGSTGELSRALDTYLGIVL